MILDRRRNRGFCWLNELYTSLSTIFALSEIMVGCVMCEYAAMSCGGVARGFWCKGAWGKAVCCIDNKLPGLYRKSCKMSVG